MRTPGALWVCGSIVVLVGVAYGDTRTQSFDSQAAAEAAGWAGSGNTVEGNSYGWSDSDSAGGARGEAGGVFARAGVNDYYADTSIGTLTLDDSMAASGRLFLTNVQDFTGGQSLGWFNSDEPIVRRVNNLSIRLHEQSTTQFRLEPMIESADGIMNPGDRQIQVLPTDTHYWWELTYDPDGGNNGFGMVTLKMYDDDAEHALIMDRSLHLTETQRAEKTLTVNSFGWFHYSQSSNPDAHIDLFADDLTYTLGAPPPECSPGDADNDGDVDDDDLSLLLANWGSETAGCEQGEFSDTPPVDDDDLSLLLANWTGPLAGAVPEPATVGLIALGSLLVVRRKR